MFKDILTSLGPDYRDASLIKLYFVVLKIKISKILSISLTFHIKMCQKTASKDFLLQNCHFILK